MCVPASRLPCPCPAFAPRSQGLKADDPLLLRSPLMAYVSEVRASGTKHGRSGATSRSRPAKKSSKARWVEVQGENYQARGLSDHLLFSAHQGF